ncbi:hypothetical protein BGZ60DRAFT_420928 [Tricladium varicosporioides]|nr:hypothetical protein BGZ60DRAFT_420928 [Hymenoscyphus varicosporioides]
MLVDHILISVSKAKPDNTAAWHKKSLEPLGYKVTREFVGVTVGFRDIWVVAKCGEQLTQY